ncbi:diaminopimelate epimerase [Actinotalea caeni]|uniref:diaminopimelate epimerase n=1 Tax=Actinotalea caeni TaxID=1348467 RepID=UPI0012E0E238|nr:diaminopimelate epimerase [Actinotalea caeni]
MTGARTFVKAHGTGNDFLLYSDVDGTDPLATEDLVALADRHLGIGADGVIRAVRTAAVDEASDQVAAAEWFMDYRNADGSVAEMCGNGIRTYVAYLEHTGLLDLQVGEATTIATRAGTLVVHKEDDGYAVEMGTWTVPGGEPALADGFDVTVGLAGLDEPRPGLRVATPNPHTVIALSDLEELEAVDLSVAPRLEPEPADGSNVEVVVPLGEREVDVVDDDGTVVGTERIGVVRMRVHERGVGETLSCGTGACAAAIATRIWFGDDAPDEWVVLVPGGRLRVRMLEGGAVELAGPAEIVAEVTPLG